MERPAHARSLPESIRTAMAPSRVPAPAPAAGDRHADPPGSIEDGVVLPHPGPPADGGPEPRLAPDPTAAQCRAATIRSDEPVRIDLVWRDPVTGLDLQLDLEGPPALVDRLIAEGFRAPDGAGGDGDDLDAA